MNIKISLAQFNIQYGNPEINFQKASKYINQAKDADSSLILLPELWSTGFDLQNSQSYQENNRHILHQLSQFSHTNNISIGGSTIENPSNDTSFNTFTYISAENNQSTKYQKIHLFKLMDEHKWLSAGKETQTISLAHKKAGLAICYDLRFPELFRLYALQNAYIILLVAAWPIIRIDHWKTLLKARAIENQIYIAAVNCVGKTKHETFGGSSMIINPWGEILVEGNSHDEALLSASIDFSIVDDIRQRIPVFDDRRPDIY